MTTPKTTLPLPGKTTLPFWHTELHELDSFRSTEELPAEVDLAIIGAGFSGVSAAYHLYEDKEHAAPGSVLMLEARGACSGATGRNGGQCKADLYSNILKYTHKFGAEQAASIAKFEFANVLAVKALVESEGIDCDFVLTRSLDVYLDPEQAAQTEANYRELARLGVADLHDVQMLRGADAEAASGVRGAHTVFSVTAGHVWPYKMIMHLLAKLVREHPPASFNLQTHTPVAAVADAPDADGRWTLTTDRGRVRARQLLFASNGYTAALAPQFHARIVPVRGICTHITAPAAERAVRRPLVNTYSLRHGPGLADYLIPRLDGTIVVGGGKGPFWHDKSHWYGVTDDSTLIGPAAHYFDTFMQHHFRGWEASAAAPDYVWTGIMGWTADFMPYVGPVPGKPGQFISAGFSGHGMPQILLANKGLVQMLHGQPFAETGLPALFEPTEARLLSEKNELLDL